MQLAPDQVALLPSNLTLTGDGNVVGNNNQVSVVKQTGGDYSIQIGAVNLILSLDALLWILTPSYTPPLPPDPDADPIPDSGPLPPGSCVPFHRNALFTGRVEHLRTLARTFLPQFTIRNPQSSFLITQGIQGMGGVGKTQLAVEFAYRYGRFFHGVHWLNAAQVGGLVAELAACGRRWRCPTGLRNSPIRSRARWANGSAAGRGWWCWTTWSTWGRHGSG